MFVKQATGLKHWKTWEHNQNISHLFFVNDLKLFATNMNQMKLLLD